MKPGRDLGTPTHGARQVLCDFHVHTGLSPCAEDEMSPEAIAGACSQAGVEVVGIADHNSARNVRACAEAGRREGILVLPGIEVQTREDVHVLTFFEDLDVLASWQEVIYSRLPQAANREEFFGRQTVFGWAGRPDTKEERMLLTATDLGLEQVCAWTAEHGGLCVLAHVDRASYSVVSNLGFIPYGLRYDAVEVSVRFGTDAGLARVRFGIPTGRPVVLSSDAHRISEIGAGATLLRVSGLSWGEVTAAVRHGGVEGLWMR